MVAPTRRPSLWRRRGAVSSAAVLAILLRREETDRLDSQRTPSQSHRDAASFPQWARKGQRLSCKTRLRAGSSHRLRSDGIHRNTWRRTRRVVWRRSGSTTARSRRGRRRDRRLWRIASQKLRCSTQIKRKQTSNAQRSTLNSAVEHTCGLRICATPRLHPLLEREGEEKPRCEFRVHRRQWHFHGFQT